ncbi:hypothetical protein HYZ99_01950, partial [Candidatus Peregrinibacteria bacterium]|nr:hypothetical protein [Candidatus Peregrinibacteria bacterium]
GSDSTNETLTFLNAADRFEFSDDVAVTGNLTASGTLTIAGATVLQGASTFIGAAVFNEPGEDIDFRIESENNERMLFVDASKDFVSIGLAATANAALHIMPTLATHAALKVQGQTGQSANLTEWQNSDGTALASVGPTGSGSFPVLALGSSTFQPGLHLEVIGTASGRRLHAQDYLTSSGGLSVLGNMYSRADNAKHYFGADNDASIAYNGTNMILKTNEAGGGNLHVDAPDGLFFTKSGESQVSFGTVFASFIAGSSEHLYMRAGNSADSTLAVLSTGFAGVNTLTPETAWEVVGTASGRILHAQDELRSSGSLVVDGATVLNSTVRINSVTYTFPAFDGSASGKVLKTDGAGQLSWSADNDTGGSGITYASVVGSFVNVSGDTMTGSLILNGANVGLTASGQIKTKSDIIGSGALVIGGAGTIKGDLTINSDAGAADTVLTFGSDSTNETLKFLNNEDRFEFSDDVAVTGNILGSGAIILKRASGTSTGNILVIDTKGLVYDATNKRVGIGTTSPETILEIIGIASGRILHAQDLLRSSGALSIDGTATFNSGGTITSPGAGLNSEKYGQQATAGGASAIAIGYQASADVVDAVAIGHGAIADTTSNGVAIGADAQSLAQNAYALGSTSRASGINSVAIGVAANAAGGGAVVIGAAAAAGNATDIGVAIGAGAVITGSIDGTAVGLNTVCTAVRCIAIGNGASATHNSFVFGVTANSTANNQFVAGDENLAILNVYFGEGVVDASPVDYTINGTGGNGTDIKGGALILAGGKSTGSAQAGTLLFQTGTPGASSTTLQTLSTRMVLSGSNVGIGSLTPETSLEVVGTASGRILHAQDELRSSGSLVVEGATVLNSTVRLNSVTYTFPAFDGSASGKVLKTNGAGQLAWSADNDTGGSGITYASVVGSFVNVSGDTMTGSLILNGANVGLTASGQIKTKSDIIGSGALVIGGAGTIKGDLTINSDAGAADTVLTFGSDSTNETLKFLNNEDRFEFSDDIHATGSITTSGALVVNNASRIKNNLTVAGTISGAIMTLSNLRNCSTLKTNNAGNLSCGSGSYIIEKNGDESVTSSDVLQNDDDLKFAMAANTAYYVEMQVWFTADDPDALGNGGFKYTFTIPTAAQMRLNTSYNTGTGAGLTDCGIRTSGQVCDAATGEYDGFITVHGTVQTSATSGNFQFQWAQSAVNTDPTVVRANSILKYTTLS